MRWRGFPESLLRRPPRSLLAVDLEMAEPETSKEAVVESDMIQGIGRELALRYLASKDLEVIAARWLCTSGSIDIIARDGEALAFATVEAGEGAK